MEILFNLSIQNLFILKMFFVKNKSDFSCDERFSSEIEIQTEMQNWR